MNQFLCVEYDCSEKTTVANVYGPFESNEAAVAFGRTLSDSDLEGDEYGDYCTEDGDPVFATSILCSPTTQQQG